MSTGRRYIKGDEFTGFAHYRKLPIPRCLETCSGLPRASTRNNFPTDNYVSTVREPLPLCTKRTWAYLHLRKHMTYVLLESAWKSWRLHTLDVRMEHDRETNVEAIPR